MAYDGNKLTKVEALKALAERVNNDFITKTEAQKQIKQEVAQAGHANRKTSCICFIMKKRSIMIFMLKLVKAWNSLTIPLLI